MRIEQNNNVQIFSAVNAFKSNSCITKPENKDVDSIIENTGNGIKSAPKTLLERVDTEEVKKFAEYAGEYNITDEDIKYGLMYGRSVIAEWLC